MSMSLTAFQKKLTSAIAEGEITDAVTFMERFCAFDKKSTGALLIKDIHLFYVSQNLDENHRLCREFVSLTEFLKDKGLIRFSYEKSGEPFQILKSEDSGSIPAHRDKRMIEIILGYVGQQDNGLVSTVHVVPLPELSDFIDKGYGTSELTGVKIIDDVVGFSKQFMRRPFLITGTAVVVILVFGLNKFIGGCMGEKGKQAANTSVAGRAHLSALKPAINLRMSDDVFNINASFSFKNAGNSGATKIQGFAKLILSDESFEPAAHGFVHVLDSMRITQTGPIRLRNNEAPFLRQSWAVEHDSLFIYLFGKIDYRDVFDKWHWTEFAFKYNYSRGEFEECCD